MGQTEVSPSPSAGNTSIEELERFTGLFLDEEEEEDLTVTVTTTTTTTSRGTVDISNKMPLPVCPVRVTEVHLFWSCDLRRC